MYKKNKTRMLAISLTLLLILSSVEGTQRELDQTLNNGISAGNAMLNAINETSLNFAHVRYIKWNVEPFLTAIGAALDSSASTGSKKSFHDVIARFGNAYDKYNADMEKVYNVGSARFRRWLIENGAKLLDFLLKNFDKTDSEDFKREFFNQYPNETLHMPWYLVDLMQTFGSEITLKFIERLTVLQFGVTECTQVKVHNILLGTTIGMLRSAVVELAYCLLKFGNERYIWRKKLLVQQLETWLDWL